MYLEELTFHVKWKLDLTGLIISYEICETWLLASFLNYIWNGQEGMILFVLWWFLMAICLFESCVNFSRKYYVVRDRIMTFQTCKSVWYGICGHNSFYDMTLCHRLTSLMSYDKWSYPWKATVLYHSHSSLKEETTDTGNRDLQNLTDSHSNALGECYIVQ